MQLGIDDIAFATADRYLDLANLAPVHGVEPAKYSVGLGQDRMSICAPDEDVVTLAATAALPLVEGRDTSAIRTVLLATESGIDQSKSAGVYVHKLLGLHSACRVVELKQACYAGTSALQMALALVARNPEQQVLVICADVARYDIGSSGEPTQGCGAVAMIVSANPRLVEIEPTSGLHTAASRSARTPTRSPEPGRTTRRRAASRSPRSTRSATTSRSPRWPSRRTST
jgi:hydroxymethylglutaryl-CoA synthase